MCKEASEATAPPTTAEAYQLAAQTRGAKTAAEEEEEMVKVEEEDREINEEEN